jgi:hypothetical protein
MQNLWLRSAVKKTLLSVFATLFLSTVSFAQPSSAGPGANPFPQNDNQWHLGYSVLGYSPTSTFAEVAVRQFGDNSAGSPQEINDVYVDLTNKLTLANSSTDCVNTGPSQTNACAFTSRSATQEDDHHIRYSFKNWGGRCNIWLRINVFAPAPSWIWADLTPWSSGTPFIVVLPVGGANPIVFGKLKGANIYFTPSDPLSATDAQNFTLLEPSTVVPGLGTIYRFRAK